MLRGKVIFLLCFFAARSLEVKAEKAGDSSFIVVDQFGYLPHAEKIAVLRIPAVGYDAASRWIPGKVFDVIDAKTKASVVSLEPKVWNEGKVDASSGDRAFWIDFSAITKPGTYYIKDKSQNVASAPFEIREGVYRKVLEAALRTFFYQRAGIDKSAVHAGAGWADKASHIGPKQDKQSRKWDSQQDAATERDLSGGWYDAGDYNKYTSWTASYIIGLLRAYDESPQAFGDQTNIPESGNGIPDILDEAKWGMDWLVRMQSQDGSVLSIVGVAQGSPPSSATGPSLYGDASTSSTLHASAAFAYGSKIFGGQKDTMLKAYGSSLLSRAVRAYKWADSHPNVIFRNNEGKTHGLGGGQQEVDDYGRWFAKIAAACYLAEMTKDISYKKFFETNYTKAHLFEWTYATPFEQEIQETLLYYSDIAAATPSVRDHIRGAYTKAMGAEEYSAPTYRKRDPYLAYIKEYTWGSNGIKASQGLMYLYQSKYKLLTQDKKESLHLAAHYLHYLHGVNPLGLVYLSNMSAFGATRSVTELYHFWFADGSEKWDKVGTSQFGPPPGFLTGGPNPSYNWDQCCPKGCSGYMNNKKCSSESIEPPKGQPPQKAYKDFNTGWPLNSWAVTENSNKYQVAYLRLLAAFATGPH